MEPIPSYRRPPIIESVVGVQFQPVESLSVAHLGIFWEKVRSDFPRIEIHPPLTGDVENLGQQLTGADNPVSLTVGQFPSPRCWVVSESGHELVQLQQDRFIFNWRKLDPDTEYPRYENYVRPRFFELWTQFVNFLADENLKQPSVMQAEITYVNLIPQGDAWLDTGQWESVFKIVGSLETLRFLPRPETSRFAMNFRLPNDRGRLRVTATHAINQVDGSEAIKLQLTARGKPATSEIAVLEAWFDLGREWVVRGFHDLTTDRMHALWDQDS